MRGTGIEETLFQRLFDNRGKILIFVNMDEAGPGYHFCREYAVRVAFLHRHQAVGSEQNGSRDTGKFFLLVLPCGSEISF